MNRTPRLTLRAGSLALLVLTASSSYAEDPASGDGDVGETASDQAGEAFASLPVAGDSTGVATWSDGYSPSVSEEDGTVVDIPWESDDGTLAVGPAGDSLIAYPGADFTGAVADPLDDTTVAYADVAPNTNLIVQNLGADGFRWVAEWQEGADTKISVDLGLDSGATLDIDPEDSEVLILNAEGVITFVIPPPWATDADGKELPAWYELSGTTLTLVVDASSAVWPVVADPQPTPQAAAQKVAADNAILEAIAKKAKAAVGKSALASKYPGSPWLTDIEGGDGQRMRAAICDYATYAVAQKYNYCPNDPVADLNKTGASTRTKMEKEFAAPYSDKDIDALVEQIARRYWSMSFPACTSFATQEQSTLSFMDIKAQCKEEADRLVKDGGGSAKSYGTTGVSDPKDIRPGFYAFWSCSGSTCKHAAIVTDVMKNGDGSVSQVNVAESNWELNWSNPTGAVPWERKVTSRPITAAKFGSWKFVNPL